MAILEVVLQHVAEVSTFATLDAFNLFCSRFVRQTKESIPFKSGQSWRW